MFDDREVSICAVCQVLPLRGMKGYFVESLYAMVAISFVIVKKPVEHKKLEFLSTEKRR